jgi:hypothetical protein
MEVLQVVAGPLPGHGPGKDFFVRAALAPPMDFGEILEKK